MHFFGHPVDPSAPMGYLNAVVTGKPQTLRLDIETWREGSSSLGYVFVCASPQPMTSDIWKALYRIRAATLVEDEAERKLPRK